MGLAQFLFKCAVKGAITAVIRPIIRKSMGLGPDTRSFPQRVIESTIAKAALDTKKK